MLCRLTDVRHAPSEPPAERTLDGDRRDRVRRDCGRPCMTALLTQTARKTGSAVKSFQAGSTVVKESHRVRVHACIHWD